MKMTDKTEIKNFFEKLKKNWLYYKPIHTKNNIKIQHFILNLFLPFPYLVKVKSG